jgi:signal transduction histidine kinase
LTEHAALAAHHAQLYGALQQAYGYLRQTHNAVMEQERLFALGQMASGIAHDINNAISPITLYAEALLEAEQRLSERGRRYLEIIQRAIGDVAQTVSRMREFYRQREPRLPGCRQFSAPRGKSGMRSSMSSSTRSMRCPMEARSR